MITAVETLQATLPLMVLFMVLLVFFRHLGGYGWLHRIFDWLEAK